MQVYCFTCLESSAKIPVDNMYVASLLNCLLLSAIVKAIVILEEGLEGNRFLGLQIIFCEKKVCQIETKT